MADEPGYPSDGGRQAPDFLTVDQTADVLQIGRSTTYELVGRFVRSAGADGIPAILVGGQYRIPRARLEEYAGRSITWPPPPRTRKHRPHRSSRKGASPTAEPAPQAPDQSDELRAPGAADAAPGLKHDLDAEPGRRAGQGLDVGIEAGIGGAAVETAAPAADVRDIEEAPTDEAETRRDDTIDSQQSLPFER
jgi:excisionase family DNA binding protein